MANNLLDKSSIILTPTAYDNGKALCVKPSDGSGDFDFSRNSAATRVNAQGLVENVQILSSNLVQNGDFSEEGVQEVSNGSFSQEGSEEITNGDFENGSTGWTLNGWTISNGKANCNGITANLIQSNVGTANKNFKVVFTISDYISGVVRPAFVGLNAESTDFSGNGTYTAYISSLTDLRFVFYGNLFNGSIDNVSVREVAQNWNLIGTATITENQANIVTASAVTGISQSNILTIGKSYKLSYNIVSNNNGGLKISGNEIPSVVGNNIYYFEASAASLEILRNSGITDISITNISVKEVGQDWDLTATSPNIVQFQTDQVYLKRTVSAANELFQSVFVIGKTYKLTIQANIISEGIAIEGNGNLSRTNLLSDANVFYLTPTSNLLRIICVNNTTEGYITNISVIEITDDTSLPRINYEGFSYQDALGSELLTDGAIINFGGGSFTFTPNGLIAISDGTSTAVARPILVWNTLTIGKQYRIVGTPTINSGNTNYAFYDGVAYIKNQVAVEAFDITFTCNGASVFFTNDGTQTFDIDWDLSIKEYLGQEVVPDSGCGSWLWEPQSTNLIPYSEDFSQWSTKTNISVTLNSAISPEGVNSAAFINENSSNAQHFIGQSFSFTNGQDVTISVYAKKNQRDVLQISPSGNYLSTSGYANYDLTNGLVTASGGGVTAEIETLTNDWYRCIAKFTANNSATGTTAFFLQNSTTASRGASYQGDGTSGLYLWGAQVEALSYPTSYIPTSGSTVTRNQDLCTNGGSLASINSTEGVFYAEIAALANDGTNRVISISDGTTSQRISIVLGTSSNQIRGQVLSSGTSFDFSTTSYNTLNNNKIAISYKLNDFSMWINGTKVSADTSGNTPIGMNEISFNAGATIIPFFGKTKALAVWKEALSDAELTELTTI